MKIEFIYDLPDGGTYEWQFDSDTIPQIGHTVVLSDETTEVAGTVSSVMWFYGTDKKKKDFHRISVTLAPVQIYEYPEEVKCQTSLDHSNTR